MVIKEEVYIRFIEEYRMLHIYLPKNYATSKKKYPVLYMFDGHNLFDDNDATYGKSWNLASYLDTNNIPLIIIGIECNHEGNKRLEEFSPYNFMDTYIGDIKGCGKQFMEWVVTDLKSWVDDHFRTLKSRKNTGIAGSSMGGLMALYGVLHHNDTFSKAACLSSFFYGIEEELINEIKDSSPALQTTIYLSYGSDEFRSKNQLARTTIAYQSFTHQLLKHNISIFPNLIFKGRHCEASWEKEVPVFIPYLFKK